MSLPRTIVVGTDFSDQSNAAAAYAVELAAKLEARVHLVHAWSMPTTTISFEMPAPFTGSLYDQLEKDARTAMAQAVERISRPHVAIETSVVFDDPRDAVIAQAAKLKAELIVVGTHGRRGIRRALIGSIAEGIVRLAPCPVLVVR